MVSVIIPVYNSSKTIIKAIDSVLNQTYKELEVIVVDDESIDDTLSVLHSYDDEDRVKIFHIKHSGCVYAYSYGIKKAKYDYIMMLDSDDEYRLDYVFKMINLMIEKGVDSVVAAYDIVNGSFKNTMYNKLNTGTYLTSKINKICNKAFSNQFDIIPVRYNHIYKKEIITSFIDEINVNVRQREDNIFNYLYLKNSYNIYVDNDINSYIYHVNPNSITNNFNVSLFYEFLYSIDFLYQLSNDYSSCQALLIDSISICLSKSIDNNISFNEIKDILKVIGKSDLLKEKIKNTNYSFKEKVAINLLINKRYKILYNSYKLLKRTYNG